MTTAEILEETIAYYVTDPQRRAAGRGGCDYVKSDGRRCAVGRCMRPEARNRAMLEGIGDVQDLDEEVGLARALWPRYQGAPLEFWKNLQEWHDGTKEDTPILYWDAAGLTSLGEARANELREKWA